MIIYLNEYRKKAKYIDNTNPDDTYNARLEYKTLLDSIGKYDSKFKLLYVLSKYPHDCNLLYILYEELQRSLYYKETVFHNWIIEFCKEHIDDIINDLTEEIIKIEIFITKYDKVLNAPCLISILKRHKYYLNGYSSFFRSNVE